MDVKSGLSQHKHVLIYGASMAAFLLVLKWLSTRLIIISYAFELYMGSIAVLFTVFGVWLALKLMKPREKTVVVEKAVYVAAPGEFETNETAIREMGLSQRELQVLQLMAAGLSNGDIAGHLHISLDTVKSHTRNLYVKMDVQRRTQAVDKARRLGIIA